MVHYYKYLWQRMGCPVYIFFLCCSICSSTDSPCILVCLSIPVCPLYSCISCIVSCYSCISCLVSVYSCIVYFILLCILVYLVESCNLYTVQYTLYPFFVCLVFLYLFFALLYSCVFCSYILLCIFMVSCIVYSIFLCIAVCSFIFCTYNMNVFYIPVIVYSH